MRKILMAAVGLAALAGAAGLALAQEGGQPGPHGMFQADSNGDGVITRQEFDAGHDAMFARMDSNNDGSLSRDEFHAGHGRHRGEHGGHGNHHRMHLEGGDANNDGNITRDEFLARPLEMFAQLDTNNDGVISAQEREQVRQMHRDGRRGDRQRSNPDANNDGQVSRDEFRAASGAHFDRMDANHDGQVTRDEMMAGFRGHHGGQ